MYIQKYDYKQIHTETIFVTFLKEILLDEAVIDNTSPRSGSLLWREYRPTLFLMEAGLSCVKMPKAVWGI